MALSKIFDFPEPLAWEAYYCFAFSKCIIVELSQEWRYDCHVMTRVKSGTCKFGLSAKFGQRACLFHSSIIEIKKK